MGSYELHAWRDAIALADFMREQCAAMGLSLSQVRRRYETFDRAAIREHEQKVSDLIAEMIRRSESQRNAYFRKICKDVNDDTKIARLVLCVLGAVRVRDILELRDQYREALAPGSGNRITAASIHEFGSRVADLYTYDWPSEVFDAMGIYDIASDDDA
jgi:hypothetical protein